MSRSCGRRLVSPTHFVQPHRVFEAVEDRLTTIRVDIALARQQVAQRLTACLRDKDTVARLGGDEFVLLLEDISDDPAQAAATRRPGRSKRVSRMASSVPMGKAIATAPTASSVELMSDITPQAYRFFGTASAPWAVFSTSFTAIFSSGTPNPFSTAIAMIASPAGFMCTPSAV